jgi:CRISPR-associated protein (Cas_Cas2CT1978)
LASENLLAHATPSLDSAHSEILKPQPSLIEFPMALFERPPLEALAPAKDRWTPLYLEHGRLEVDDSSVKWIGADGLLCRVPVATVSALILGPGTTVTHAAMKACAESNSSVCWTGEDSLRFYAFGLTPNRTNDMPRLHAEAWADKRRPSHVSGALPRSGREREISEGIARHGRLAGANALRARAGRRSAFFRPHMTVLVANDTPPAIRGMLKRWFVEPKPNVLLAGSIAAPVIRSWIT